ncbi:MAG: DNA-binding response regulator [Actinobacteria bacterium]|nr:MAG: DNA-binding response regulator [Actinomycetota bacterium]
MTKILIVEDDKSLRETLEYNLRAAGFDVLTASDGDKGLTSVKTEEPDLILLDILLPEMDGFRLCGEIRKTDEDLPIIMVTALSDEQDKLKSFALGADDYITKPFSINELLARVRANLKRAKVRELRESDPIETGDLRIDPERFVVEVAGEPVRLTVKEFQLLTLLASNPESVFERRRLSEKVWGYDFVGSSRTIDSHVWKLRSKIERSSAYRYIHTLVGLGYQFRPEAKHADTD